MTDVDWYECVRVRDGLIRIRERHVYEVAQANLWYVRGRERDLLIDSGTGLRPLTPVLPPSHGRPVIAVATHVHFDHVGSHHEFSDRRAHGSEAAAFASMHEDKTLVGYFRTLDGAVRILPHDGWQQATYNVNPAPLTHALAEGDIIDLGDRQFRVLHLPGHSPDSIGLYEERTGTLFSGDAIYDGELFDNLQYSNVEQYLETMERLRQLEARVCHGGHGPSFDNGRKAVLVDAYLSGKRVRGCGDINGG